MSDVMDNSEPLMDCNFAEMLAVDLEQSRDVFQSKHLTAGAPAPDLVDDGSKRRYSLQSRSLGQAYSSHRSDAQTRFRSMDNVHQKYSQVAISNKECHKPSSDSDTASSEWSSGGMEQPLSASINTAATSINSERQLSPVFCKRPAPMSPTQKSEGESWMDLEIDEPVSATSERRHSMVNLSSPQHLSPGGNDMGDLRSMSLNSRVTPANIRDPFIAFHTPASTSSPAHQSRMADPPKLPPRRSSLNHRDYPVPPQLLIPPRSSVRTPSPNQVSQRSSKTSIARQPASPPRPKKDKHPEEGGEKERASMFASGTATAKMNSHASKQPHPRPEPKPPRSQTARAMDPLTISSTHMTNIELWLESSIEAFSPHSPHTSDFNHHHHPHRAPLPLPPDVIDTLRISVSCFPETMLLCSSLSIETIRSRSRKLTYSSEAALRVDGPSKLDLITTATDGAPSNDSSNSTRRPPSRWKRMITPSSTYPSLSSPSSSRKQQPQPPPAAQLSPYPPSPLTPDFAPPAPAAALAPARPDWTPIKVVFPSGTDYLCDALYAHLVAYNHITSLCPRSALLNPTGVSPTTVNTVSSPHVRPSSGSSDTATLYPSRTSTSSVGGGSNGIPRKAAFLLGLEQQQQHGIEPPPSPGAGARTSTLKSKRSFLHLPGRSNGGGRPSTSAGGPGTASGLGLGLGARPALDSGDYVLRDLRLGLAKCIARLVATLRSTSSSPSSGGGLYGSYSPGNPAEVGLDGEGEGGDEEGVVRGVSREEDPLFMRALCEIVRCCEER
ncbi:hypothetical protein F4778DRAFT_785782 [Xylariomycetidae sp. FL2044]|nr:hypothetical protein F4778DRAFT_785782 [Xylariomycetidae sp. FL2044]